MELERKGAKTDWNLKEQVRASLRMKIRFLLSRHGYSDKATTLVLSQAELFADLVNTRGLGTPSYIHPVAKVGWPFRYSGIHTYVGKFLLSDVLRVL